MATAEEKRTAVDRALEREFIRIICEYEADPELAPHREGWFVDWEDGDRSGFELPGAHLPNAKLARADFTDAILDGANLRGADLSDTKLVRASLVGADLTDAILEGADLDGADLKDAIGPPARP